MFKKIILVSLLLLTSCITIKTDATTPTPGQPGFVTATLPPTRAGFVPATVTPTPAATTPPTLAVTAPANCKDSAVLLRDVTIPDNTKMEAGEKFTKTWEFQNTGKCPWKGYTLKFDSGDQMSAPLSAPVPDTAPKDKVQVSVELTAPTDDGAYTGYFTLNDASGNMLNIGTEKTFWLKIMVGNGLQQATSTPFISVGDGANCDYSLNDGYVQQVISLINQARISANLSPLTVNTQLASAAQSHSLDMACHNFNSHSGSDGSWIYDRLLRAGYPANTHYVEILGFGTPQDAMSQWRGESSHWAAVLDAAVTEIGVGYVYNPNSNFGSYFTVDMGGQ